jgi:hypothetical protein
VGLGGRGEPNFNGGPGTVKKMLNIFKDLASKTVHKLLLSADPVIFLKIRLRQTLVPPGARQQRQGSSVYEKNK